MLKEKEIVKTVEAVLESRGKNLPKGQWVYPDANPCEAVAKPLRNGTGTVVILRDVNGLGKIKEVGLIFIPKTIPEKTFIALE
jgi:hypothetical protein